MPASPPIPQSQLQEIVQQACESVLSNVSSYNHAAVDKQNGEIISTILNALVSSTTTSATSPQYKFAVNSTIIQHLSDPSPLSSTTSTSTATQAGPTPVVDALGANEADARTAAEVPVAGLDGSASTTADANGASGGDVKTDASVGQTPTKGRRGMHSATGAYWNEETDGMWSWKYDGSAKGMDVVVSVVWVGV